MPKIVDEAGIFGAAIGLLMSRGFEGATTKEIADSAGVNEVTLFRKYGSKTGLFEKAIEHRLRDTPLNKIAFTGDIETDLFAIVEAYLETNEVHGDIMPVILIELPRNPDLQGSMDTPWRNLQGIMSSIRAFQDRKLLMREPPLATLAALLGPIMVNQMFRRANLALPVPAIDLRAHVDAFLNGRRR